MRPRVRRLDEEEAQQRAAEQEAAEREAEQKRPWERQTLTQCIQYIHTV